MSTYSDGVTFEIVKSIGVISNYPTGWTKEVNRVRWNDGPAKIDIREWDENHKYASRGTTLLDEEAKRLAMFLNEEFSKQGG